MEFHVGIGVFFFLQNKFREIVQGVNPCIDTATCGSGFFKLFDRLFYSNACFRGIHSFGLMRFWPKQFGFDVGGIGCAVFQRQKFRFICPYVRHRAKFLFLWRQEWSCGCWGKFVGVDTP